MHTHKQTQTNTHTHTTATEPDTVFIFERLWDVTHIANRHFFALQ